MPSMPDLQEPDVARRASARRTDGLGFALNRKPLATKLVEDFDRAVYQ